MKKKILTPEIVVEIIKKEYLELLNHDLSVDKQFTSTNGRKYNTFLISAPDSPWKKFVAKSYWYEGHDLADEALFMNILRQKDTNITELIFPFKKGSTFLIMSYIEGICARELLEKPENIESVYSSIGATLNQIYAVQTPGFGKFWKEDGIDWAEFIDEKFNERLTPSIKMSLIREIKHIYREGKDIIKEDARKGPVVIHRDAYSDNFIIEKATGSAVLIDFAMAIGGRPFYDLAKFYVIDLYRDPDGQEPFLQELSFVKRDEREWLMLKAYTIIELMGMVNFFNSIDEKVMSDHAMKLLTEIVQRKGKFYDILSGFMK